MKKHDLTNKKTTKNTSTTCRPSIYFIRNSIPDIPNQQETGNWYRSLLMLILTISCWFSHFVLMTFALWLNWRYIIYTYRYIKYTNHRSSLLLLRVPDRLIWTHQTELKIWHLLLQLTRSGKHEWYTWQCASLGEFQAQSIRNNI